MPPLFSCETGKAMRLKIVLFLIAVLTRSSFAIGYFKPFNLSYDGRALLLDGRRRILISAGIHYPRAAPEMWPDLIAKTKENGVDVVQNYVFWNGHEPVKGQYNFEGLFDSVKFVKLVGSSGLCLHLRIEVRAEKGLNFWGKLRNKLQNIGSSRHPILRKPEEEIIAHADAHQRAGF